jgi:hypothetical protein
MEKVSLELLELWLSWIWLGIISLVRVALSFSFVKIDCEYYQICALRILGVKVCGEQRTVGRDLTTSRPWL